MKKTAINLSILILFVIQFCLAQSTSITPGGLELNNKGNSDVLTIPKLSNQAISAIQAPKIGSLVYDIDSNCIRVYNGNIWVCLTDSGSIPFHLPQKLTTKIIGSSQTGPQTAGSIVINAVSVDNAGNFYLAGRIFGCYSSPISVCSNYSSDLFRLPTGIVLKFSSSGAFKWATTVTGLPVTGQYPDSGFSSEVSDITIKNDKIYLIGNYSKSISWQNKIITSNGEKDIFIAKIDTSKTVNWIKNIGGISDEISSSIFIDENSNIIITGAYKSSPLIINQGNNSISLSNSGGYDTFISKFDVNGNLLGATKVGGTNDDLPESLTYQSPYFYIAGTYINNFTASTYSFTSTGGKDTFILKFNSLLSIAGANRFFGLSANDEVTPREIKFINNKLYLCGYFNGSINFGNKSLTSSIPSSFLSSFYFYESPYVDYLQTITNGGSFISVIPNNSLIYAIGNYATGATTMNIPLQSQGSSDVFLFELKKSGNFESNNFEFSRYTTAGTESSEAAYKVLSYNGKIYIFGGGTSFYNNRAQYLYMWSY
ncbi:hypothetical protein [Emticicia sp. C21]|uniref:hypothetical protein n=1 Tax=Emticicia sp. C21 TaxID=2302915 RepID=UPI000E353397|nr:hypothetical protein [Emticicia sp. C21]RFS16095.1 hypothetical protein D0T08_14495 [Emticicia sp. C21]